VMTAPTLAFSFRYLLSTAILLEAAHAWKRAAPI
jgi:hypothetical protein